MKKTIITAIVALIAIFSMAAQNSFYYSQGRKVTLSQDNSKVVSLSPKGMLPRFPSGITVSRNVQDNALNILVLEKSSSASLSTIRRQLSISNPKLAVIPCYKDANGMELAPTGYIYVELKSTSDYTKLQQTASQHGCSIVRQNKFMPLWYTLRISPSSESDPVNIANEIYETGYFSASSPDFSFDALEISYDPDVTEQWGLYNPKYENIDISASQAWNYATGIGIKIAIVDQGIELTHDDLADNIYSKSYDAYTGKSPSGVYNSPRSIGHGTHCAGIAAAVRNNNIFIAGVAPDAKLMSVSMNFDAGNAIEQVADAINWAWQNGADIISCSWVCPDEDIICRALDNAIAKGREGKGCIMVKSAGNSGGAITFPGYYKEDIIAVGNITNTGVINSGSSHGPNMLVCAPGTDILSTMVGNTTAVKGGTSMACPHVSGVAALILERNPKLSAAKVREIIARNAKKVGTKAYSTNKKYGTWNEYYGYGLVDAYKAVLNTPH